MTNTLPGHDERSLQALVSAGTVVVASTGVGALQQIMLDGRHILHADEPKTAGGDDTGPGPYELLLMALGSCTSMTVHLYATRKKWPLDQVIVTLSQRRVHADDCANCEDSQAMIHRIEKKIEFVGSLDERTLTSRIEIVSEFAPPAI